MSNVQNTTNESHVIDCIICIFLSLRKKRCNETNKKTKQGKITLNISANSQIYDTQQIKWHYRDTNFAVNQED